MSKPTGKLAFAYQTIANMEARIEALLAERDALREDRDSQQRVCIAEMEKVNQLRAEVEALKKDAERYRWLLENADLMHWENMLRFADLEGAESINQFIDAALQGEQP